jgi:murein DD-endopeptidase MepM/ murein hydrolase activator NlpD
MHEPDRPAGRRSNETDGISARLWAARPPVLLAAGLALACLALIAALPMLSSGASISSINSKLEKKRSKLQVARQHEQVLTGDISALSGKISGLSSEIASLQRREASAERTLAVKRAELARVQARYDREHLRYLKLRKQLLRAQGVLAERLVEIYKSDPPDVVSVVLGSDNFEDMLVRADYLSRIGKQDSAIVARVRDLKQRSARKRALLLTLKDQAANAVATIEAKRAELADTRAGIQSRESALASARDQKRSSLHETRGHRKDLEGDVAALEAASARVTAQLKGGPLPAGPMRQGSGSYAWPVNGPVVSGFGMRWGRLHAGVDIAAPTGTPIRASAGGTVAIAGWVGGYGNYTCIQHGGGIATCYGHQTSIGVHVGQHVRQGQVIGTVGCTGHCFGPHVHFEVRVNGTPVDPMGYL